MKIAVYTLCYNETFMLPFFMQHYRPLADRIVVFDNESTDDSRNLALNLGADEVRSFSTGNEIRTDIMLELLNTCWHELKGRGYDWVMLPDMDEMIYHRDLRGHLEHCRGSGTTICIPQGFQMVGCRTPVHGTPLHEQIRTGLASHPFSKPIIFNPDQIDELNLVAGSHWCMPTGTIIANATGSLKLLHYYWLSLEWLQERTLLRTQRLSAINKQQGWSTHYLRGDEEIVRAYREARSKAFDVVGCVEPPNVADGLMKQRLARVVPLQANRTKIDRAYLEKWFGKQMAARIAGKLSS